MIEHTDLSFPVYKKLREMILQKELKPGQKLLQEKLAQDLGVSRTPLLKALQRLEHEYLVESIPRRGMFVKKLSIKEMTDIYEVREGLESVAVRLVTELANQEHIKELKKIWAPFVGKDKINIDEYRKADERFHSLLLKFSNNQVLQKTYSRSLVEARVIQIGLQREPEETLPEHLDLMSAIEKGDVESAVKFIETHVRKSKGMIEQKLKLEESEDILNY